MPRPMQGRVKFSAAATNHAIRNCTEGGLKQMEFDGYNTV